MGLFRNIFLKRENPKSPRVPTVASNPTSLYTEKPCSPAESLSPITLTQAQDAPPFEEANSSASLEVLPSKNTERRSELLIEHEIANRANEIWQEEGCPIGRELEHWFRAEKEVRNR